MRALVIGCAVVGLWNVPPARARTFEAEGSDTGAGLGARYVAQGGTGIATSDDVHAAYYNPAGLAELQGLSLTLSRQLNARLRPLSAAGAAWRVPFAEAALGLKATIAALHYPRIHARASGAYSDSDFESLFLRYLLPGISGTFDGEIDSKTRSTRAALGVAPSEDASWSLGTYLERIDCQSDFCGVHATSNGYTTQSTRAKATAIGLGARWRVAPAVKLGVSVSDLRTRLTVNSVTTDASGTHTQRTRLAFPRKMGVAAAWQRRADQTLAIDMESTKGAYGKSRIDLQMLRLGGEQRDGPWAWRAGAVVPLRIVSSETGRLRPPYPFGPTAGVGWRAGEWQLDVALYAHAAMSMHERRASPAADLSLTLAF